MNKAQLVVYLFQPLFLLIDSTKAQAILFFIALLDFVIYPKKSPSRNMRIFIVFSYIMLAIVFVIIIVRWNE